MDDREGEQEKERDSENYVLSLRPNDDIYIIYKLRPKCDLCYYAIEGLERKYFNFIFLHDPNSLGLHTYIYKPTIYLHSQLPGKKKKKPARKKR